MREYSGIFEDPTQFWKNFRLGTELQVSGTFLYNGLFALENMKSLYYEADCFELLYNIAVGIERLCKIAIILIEHDQLKLLDSQTQQDFEKTLISHSHPDLIRRIKNNKTLNLEALHNKFLTLLGRFYNSFRYDRFNISSVFGPNKDREELISFLSDILGTPVSIEPFEITSVTDEIKIIIGNIVGKIVRQLYKIVAEEANRLKLYTAEIAVDSKAFKIFIADEFNFIGERVAQREVLIYLLKNKPADSMVKYIDDIKPLELGDLSVNEYIEGMLNIHCSRSVRDDVDQRYIHADLPRTRQTKVLLVGSVNGYHLDSGDNDDSY